jgi:two-component system, LytTR family, sensor kinase
VHRLRRARHFPGLTSAHGTATGLPCLLGVHLPRAVKWDRHPQWLIIAVIWACVGALLVIQLHPQIKDGLSLPFYIWIYAQQPARAAFWALLTPSVLRWLERWPLSGLRWWRSWLRHTLISVGLMTLFLGVRLIVMHFIFGTTLNPLSVLQTFNFRNLMDVFFYWSIIAIGWVISLNVRRQRAELHEAQLVSQLANAELAALKQQLQPHFLFNCLNALSALMRDGENMRAIDGLAKLSGLMRALMQTTGVQNVELGREIDYVQRYLALEKLRFDDRLTVEFDLEDETLGATVPTLLLQPLVENAIKHGIARRRSPGRVVVRAAIRHGRLRLAVENDPPEGADHAVKPEGQGVGLATTRARLARIYGGDYKVTEHWHGSGPARVEIELPLHTAAKPDSPP